MPDNIVEIKIAATGVSDAGAQFEGFSETASAALEDISETAGVATSALEDYAGQVDGYADSFQNAGGATQETNAQLRESVQSFLDSAEASGKASEGSGELTEKLQELGTEGFEHVKDLAIEAAAELGVLIGVTEAMKEALSTFAATEKSEVALAAITGNADQASESIQKLKELATDKALSFPDLLEANQRLTAAHFSLEQIPGALSAAADAAGAMNVPLETAVSSMERMALSGMAGARQLTSLGLTADDLGKVLGVTGERAKKAFEDLDQVQRLAALQEAMQKYGGVAKAQADTLSGAWQKSKTAMDLFFDDLGSEVAGPAKAALGEFTQGVKALGLLFNDDIDSMQRKIDGLNADKVFGKKPLKISDLAAGAPGEKGSFEPANQAGLFKGKDSALRSAVAQKEAQKIQAATASEIISNQIAAIAQQAKYATNAAEDKLKVQKAGDEAVIEAMNDAHDRANAIAQEDVTIAQEKQDRLSAINAKALADTLVQLQAKRGTVGAGKTGADKDPAAEAAEQIKISGEIAAVKAQAAEKELALQTAVDVAKANALKVEVEQTRATVQEEIRVREEAWTRIDAFEDAEARKTDERNKKAREDQRKGIETDSAGRVGALEGQRTGIETQKSETSSPTQELDYLRQIKEIDQQIIQEKLDTQAKLLKLDSTPIAGITFDPAKADEDMKKLVRMAAAGNATIAKDTEAEYKVIQKEVTGVVDAIGNDLDRNLNKWITGQESFAQAAKGAWRDIESGALTTIEHIIEKQIEQFVINKALAAAGIATQQTASAAEKLSAAKTAAANTYASVSAIPYVGWLLAPPAAAAAFVAVEAFETGGDVGGNGLAFLHAKEHVINAPLTSLLQQVATQGRGGNSSSPSSRVNVGSINYHGAQMPDKHFGQMMKRLQRNSNA